MTVNNEMRYEAPQVEVVEVEIEKGFAISDPLDGTENEMGKWEEL